MQNINININQAKIESFSVILGDDKPSVEATIILLSGQKRISSFTLSSQYDFGDRVKFELPPDMVAPIIDIAQKIEKILVVECNKALGQIGFDV